MGWSLSLGVVNGTAVRVHITFLLLLAWIGFAAYARGGQAAAIQSIIYILLLFACVVLHEFGHVFAARRYGIRTPDITLLPIGGVARLERMTEEPGQELVIALAGPAVNVVIAGILYLLIGGFGGGSAPDLVNPAAGLMERLLWVNVILAGFNMIPAFPMDGGRVLRALLTYRLGFVRGTQIAANVGQGVAFLLGLLGLFGGNVLLVFIALFVYLAATAEAHVVQTRQIAQGLTIADVTMTGLESLRPDNRLDHVVDRLLSTTQHEFPVLDDTGRLVGVLTRDELIQGLRENGSAGSVRDMMRTDVPTLHHRRPLADAFALLCERRVPAVSVTGPDGRFLGLVTCEHVTEALAVLGAHSRPSPAQSSPQRDVSSKFQPRSG
jgi:Zn-dependent protease/predicted transcriptional regulator